MWTSGTTSAQRSKVSVSISIAHVLDRQLTGPKTAFCRVYRLGQKSKTFVTRFFINGTVDERLERMQEHKQKLIGGAIDDRALLSKLSAPEIMRLFGDVQIDRKTKRPYIVMDEDERLDAILPPLSNDDVDVVMDRMGKD